MALAALTPPARLDPGQKPASQWESGASPTGLHSPSPVWTGATPSETCGSIRISRSRLPWGLNELATNAGKYGALASPAGRITLTARVETGENGDEFRLAWQEDGGPAGGRPNSRWLPALVV